MLSEEALIVLAALVACAALILGALELKWPSRPRHPVRRTGARQGRSPRRSTRPRHSSEALRAPYVRRSALHVTPEAGMPLDVPSLDFKPVINDDDVTQRIADSFSVVENPVELVESTHDAVEPEPVDTPAVEPVVSRGVEPVVSRAVEPFGAMGGPSTVETCFELYQERRFADVIALGTAALDDDPPATPQETAALWSVLALAQQATGDDAGARASLESAIAAAPASDRATYQRQLVSLALTVAQAGLGRAANHPNAASQERVSLIREAVAWLARAQATAGREQTLADLQASAHALLWPAYEQVVMALVQQQDFRAARRHLREALDDPAFPAARAERFRELFSGTFSGEIGQLTAQAIRSMQDARESEALGSLNRAETLLDTISEEALPPTRREEVDRRLWWGYNKLGLRRLNAGEYEEALEPLFHAARFEGVGPERRAETRAALARALHGVVETRTLTIRQVADEGDRESAVLQADKLWGLLRSADECGITQQELSTAFASVQRLIETLGRPERPGPFSTPPRTRRKPRPSDTPE